MGSTAPNSGFSGRVTAIPFVPSQSNSSISSIKEFNPNPTPDINLPDGDEVLGISSNTQLPTTQNLAAQAARMFDSFRLDQPSPSTQFAPPHLMGTRGFAGASNTVPSSSSFNKGPQQAPSSSINRGFNAPHNINTANTSRYPPPSSSSSTSERGRGRGRGRGGRGRGNPPPTGPGANRPFVSAHALDPGRMQLAGRFISETLRRDMEHRRFITTTQLDEDTLRAAGLPPMVQQYHTLCPLEDADTAAERPSTALGVCSFVFKGIHAGDGAGYAVRRIDGRHVIPTAEVLETAEQTVMQWSPIANHPNLVGLREVFVSDEVDATPSLFFSYDLHAGAYTMEQMHMMGNTPPVTEEQLWSYIVQLTSALRAIHSAGLVAGQAALAPSKVIVTSPSRVRLAAIGLSQAMMLKGTLPPTTPEALARAHREDLSFLGQLLLVIACSGRNAPAPGLDILTQHYSRELCRIVAGLLAAREPNGFPSWQSVATALGDRIFAELQSTQTACDTLSNEMEKECDNGRIARLLIKLSMVNERPELLGDVRWSDTGDRYLLKLFRDFVFHQVDENGRPSMEWGSVIEALNKADAGIEEKIMLLSRDETSMLVVSYGDVKRCLLSAYDELRTASGQNSNSGGGGVYGGGRY